MNDLAKLNRLRVNAGKPELASFKASPEKLDEAIKKLEDAGFTDVLPGANEEAAPVSDDPEVQAARPPEEPPQKKEPTKTSGKPSLARGLDTDTYAKHSRTAVRDHREREKKEKALLSPEDRISLVNWTWIPRSLVPNFGATRTRSASCIARVRIVGPFRGPQRRPSPTSSSNPLQNIVALVS
jgi:hypothetical protein